MPAAIVTGSDSGIGKATAVALAQRGFDVGVTFHTDEDGARATAQEVESAGRRAEVRRLDLLERGTAAAVIADLAGALGGLDVFVANAGMGHSEPAVEHDERAWRDVLEVDLTGAFLTMQAAARHMIEHGTTGRIVAVTSVHEHVPLEGSVAYVAAKHGLGGVVKVMALELAPHGITVNAVAPGEIATAMTGQEDEDPRSTERAWIPAGRPGDAREIAAAICALAEQPYTTGHSLVVDGGMLLMAAVANQRGG